MAHIATGVADPLRKNNKYALVIQQMSDDWQVSDTYSTFSQL